MPLFWKYLLKNFCKIFFLSIFGFNFLLLLTRANDIAKYASLATNLKDIVYFILIQIPHILPLSIPLSCFIASFILIKNLSLTSELSAFRAASLSISQVITPILVASLFLGLINFYISSEFTPKLRHKSQNFLIEKTSKNPIELLKKQKLLKINNSFINFEEEGDTSVKDFIFVMFHPSSKKLLMFTAKELVFSKNNLQGLKSALITFVKTEEKLFDHIIIENQMLSSTPSDEIAKVMKKNKNKLLHTFTSLKHLKLRSLDLKSKKIYQSELYRRTFLGLYTFVFSFIGVTFGISIQKTESKKSLLLALICLGIILTSYLSAKHLKTHPNYSLSIYVTPLFFIGLICINTINNKSKGK